MKIQSLFLLFFIVVTLSGCSLGSSALTATDSVSPAVTSLLASASPTKLLTQTVTSTPLPIATQTPVPTQTSSPTSTVTSSPTLTQPPTLEPEQAEEIIKEMMQEPTAPCFWGICPGQTMLKEAKNIFAHLGLFVEHTNTLDGKEYYYVVSSLESGLGIDTLLVVQKNSVKALELYIDPEPQEAVPREWLAFSSETLVHHYGTPSKVEFSVGGGPQPQYSMVVYYDDVDLIIEYFSFKDSYDKATNSFHLCPLNDQYISLHVWLGKDPEDTPLPGIMLEDATSITLDEFSELMMGDPDDACVEIPHDVIFP